MELEKLKEKIKAGEYILFGNQTREEYIGQLEDDLEDIKENPTVERVIHIVTKNGTLIKLEGKDEILKEGWEITY